LNYRAINCRKCKGLTTNLSSNIFGLLQYL